ncbi:MAG: hypothetical protein [Microvirus sp.]|nr:MAG: hypothetical protein [Microvirus sp.]
MWFISHMPAILTFINSIAVFFLAIKKPKV